jgi:TIR domain
MIRFATKAQLRERVGKGTLNERTILAKAQKQSVLGSTFLSHSSADEDIVAGTIQLLEEHGGSVYVDKKDTTLPPYTSEETAATLKERIRESRRFVLIASKNSQRSTWVPWELGVADGVKTLKNIALFPASDSADDTTWASWEYLGLYHRIVFGDLKGFLEPVWMVLDAKKNTATELRSWLTSR